MSTEPNPPAPVPDTVATQPVTDTMPPADPPGGDPNPVVPANATPADAGDRPMTRKELETWYADKQRQQPSSGSKPAEQPKPVAPAPAPKPADPPATPPAAGGKKTKGSKWFDGRPPQE